MSPWPWPGDTPLDRARRVALSYREALLKHFPDEALDLDEQFTDHGERWVTPELATVDLDEWVTVDVAAEHVGLSVAAVYQWVYRQRVEGRMGNDKRLRVKLGDAIEQNALHRRRRIARSAGRKRCA